jgi:hypothetical protein
MFENDGGWGTNRRSPLWRLQFAEGYGEASVAIRTRKSGQQAGSRKRSFFRTLGRSQFSPLKPPFSGSKYSFRKTTFDLFEPDE